MPAFHAFVRDNTARLGIDAGLLGSRLVGRWESGAPVLRARHADNPELGGDDCGNNHFEFETSNTPNKPGDRKTGLDCVDDQYPTPPADADGGICPLAGHIRKTYPRDDTSREVPPLGEKTTQTHRLLRRGLPYGPPFPAAPHDPGDRGLMFLAYQISLTEQFEFVTQNWVNNRDFKRTGAGDDMIIGQNSADADRRRTFRLPLDNADGTQRVEELTTTDEWVISTGGGYFFTPSISYLELLSS